MTSRACRALLALALFLGAAGIEVGSARADDAAAPAAKTSVAVGIGEVNPQIPDFTDTTKTMSFSGKLQNTKSTTLKNVEIELRRSAVDARSELGSATGNGRLVQFKTPSKPQDLAPGATVDWKLTPTEAELFGGKNPQAGVYAIDVDVVDSDGDFLGGQRTFVVWKPLTGAKKARVALLWPVVGMPGLTGQKKTDAAASPIVSDPQAAAQFQDGGRLDKVLRDGQRVPVNWLVDPDVLYTASQLSNGFFVANPDGTTNNQGVDGGIAKRWYDTAQHLFSSPTTLNCWNLPYSDPDLTTLSRTDTGQTLLGEALRLHAPATVGGCRQPVNGPAPTIAWPANGQADATTLKALQKAGDTVNLLSSTTVSTWKSAHVTTQQSPNTVVYDAYLSGVFNADPAPPAGQPQLNTPGVLAGQEWLAQTALLAGDYTDRMSVVAPPRDFTPQPALTSAITEAEKLGPNDQWVGLDDLGKVLDTKPITAPASLLAPKVETPNLPAVAVTSASDSQRLYHALHSIMDPSHEHDDAVPFRPVATWWRTHDGDPDFSQKVRDTVVSEHGLVAIKNQKQTLTLSGKSGTVPVTIENDTNATVRLYLLAQAKASMKLKITEDPGLQTIARGEGKTVSIRVGAEGNGDTIEVTATLYTCPELTADCAYYPSGLFTPFKQDQDKGTVSIYVKVSRIGIIALGLMIGSGALLVALIGLRVYRAKRAQHAPAQDTMAS